MTLTAEQVRLIRRLRYDYGLTSRQVAARVGVTRHTVDKYAPGRPSKVPVAPLRERFLASGLTASEVAVRMGWMDRGNGDSSRVKRLLGLLDDVAGGGRRSRRVTADAEAVELCADAIGVMAWEVLPDRDESWAA